jgi:hypothetical protein
MEQGDRPMELRLGGRGAGHREVDAAQLLGAGDPLLGGPGRGPEQCQRDETRRDARRLAVSHVNLLADVESSDVERM